MPIVVNDCVYCMRNYFEIATEKWPHKFIRVLNPESYHHFLSELKRMLPGAVKVNVLQDIQQCILFTHS